MKKDLTRPLIRWLSYPVTLLSLLLGIAALPNHLLFVALPLLVAPCLLLIAWLEQIAPFERDWLHGDTAADIAHATVAFLLMHATVWSLLMAQSWLFPWSTPGFTVWPQDWPLLAQAFLAGLPIDLGLYAMHRLSHKRQWLWSLHAIHHSPLRLYWLNGERRHPLHAFLMAAPGVLVAALLGAPAEAVAVWFAILAVHLAFQHANLDYTLGPLRHLLGVAEGHRWHHRRDYREAQVNFGEFWMIWDHLFGSYHAGSGTDARVRLGPLGIEGDPVPLRYIEQLKYPFNR